MDEQEYEEIIQCLIDKDGMVVDEETKNVNLFIRYHHWRRITV